MSGFKSRLVTFFALLLGLLMLGLLTVPRAEARDWLVPSQAPTIQAAVDSAITGDAIVLAPGIYDDCTTLNSNNQRHIAILKNGIDLRGETGDPAHVILDAGWQGRCLEMRSFTDTTRISGITFRRARALNPFGSGGAIYAFSAMLELKDCVFDSCDAQYSGGAVYIGAGSLAVSNSVFTDCGTDNIGAAIRATGTPLSITGTTFFRSRGTAVHYATHAPVITNTIISGGDAAPMSRNNSADPAPDISCSDIWGNETDWTDFLAGMDAVNDNLSVDPQFCNPLFGNVGLYASSGCAPEINTTCGLIGGRPVGCGAGAVTHLVAADGSGDFPTIQAAINAAADADTISLADGTFTGFGNRDLDTLGKNVIIQGQSGDPELAVIDCGGSLAEPHRGFHIFRGETGYTVLRNLTIMNADVADSGAALLIENSAPRVTNVVLTANHAAVGAAGFIAGGAPVFTDCRIIGNEGRSAAGGFALHDSRAAINDCLFRNNWGQRASALFLPDSCAVTVSRTTMNANNSAGDRACIEVAGNTVLSLNNCLVTNGNRSAARCFDLATITATNTNIHGNVEGNWTGCLASQGFVNGNLGVDPYYCDAASFDFSLRGDSECAEYNTANNTQIGAFVVGCYPADTFSDASTGLPIAAWRSTGVAWVDFNGDGKADLHVTNPAAANEALLGNGLGVFNNLGDPLAAYTGASEAAAWADFDNDGDLDVYYGIVGTANLLLANNGGQFSPVGAAAIADAAGAGGASWADYDQDGVLDLLVVRADSSCTLYGQDTAGGTFADVSADVDLDFAGGWTGSAWGDYDNNGRRDLYLFGDGTNKLLHNEASGFVDAGGSGPQDNGATRSAAWGDYDNDGHQDLLLVNDLGITKLLRNGLGTFTAAPVAPLAEGGAGRSGIFGDYDNDGDLDIFLTRCGARDRLLRNDGGSRFVDLGQEIFAGPDSSMGAAWGDYDGDGDLDLAVAVQGGATRLYRNDYAGSNHWFAVRALNAEGGAPVPGTRVHIWLATVADQKREIGAGGGYYSTDDLTAHFGLGVDTVVDSLRVIWPDGSVEVRTAVSADQVLTVWPSTVSAVGDDVAGDLPRLVTGLKGIAPNPFNPATRVRFDLERPGPVRLRVYDVAGRFVRELENRVLPAGVHYAVWRGRDHADRAVAAGVYFLRLEAGGRTWTRGAVLVK